MQLLRIKLENWRAVRSRELVLGAGVNIVEGANEAGKSSFIEALNIIFKERDSTKKKEIKSITPKGNDVGSSVEVELKTGDYHFAYSKTYNRRAATSLSIFKPQPVQYTGMQAHDEVLRMLDETIDLALWQAIQLEQGSEFSAINLRDSTGLAKALDSAAGGSGVGEADSAILDRARTEFLRYYTERAGRETGELTEVRQRRDTLSEKIASASSAMQSMQAQVERSAALAESIQEQAAALPDLKSALSVWQKKQVEIDSLHERHRTITAEFDAQSFRVDEHQRQLSERSEQQVQLTERDAAVKRLIEQRQKLSETSELLVEKIKSARQQRENKKAERSSLQKSVSELEAAMRYKADAQELSVLDSRLEQYERFQQQLDECHAEIKTHSVDDAALEALQQLQRKHREIEVRLDAQQPDLQVTALKAEAFDHETVAQGTVRKLDTSVEFEFEIGSSARITFRPAADLKELNDELTVVDLQLKKKLGQYEVADIAAAASSHRSRLALQQKIKNLQHRVNDTHDSDVAALRQRAALLRASIAQQPPAYAADDLQQQLVNTRESLDELEREQQQVIADLSLFETEKAGVDAHLDILRQQIDSEQSELRSGKEAFERQQSEVSDRDIADQLAHEKTQLQTLQSRLAEADTALSQSSPEQMAAQVGNARQAVDRASQQFHQDEKELAAVSAQLDQLRSEGLHEKLEQLHAEFNDTEDRLRQLSRAASAAKYLWESLLKHQRSTQLSYVKPLSELVCRMGRIVFGEDFQVHLNESLAIESRTLNGLTVPFDDLSGGAREQLGILLRLAATQLVAGVPLILDDTLGHTDATRLQTIGALLSTAGRQSQIVVMTCYPQRYRYVGDAQQHRLLADSPLAAGVAASEQ